MSRQLTLDHAVLASVVAQVGPTESHHLLLEALAERYPHYPFRLVAVRGNWYTHGGLIGAAGERVTHDYAGWARDQYHRHGDDAGAVWEHYKNAGLVMTTWVGESYYIAAPVAEGPADYYQIEVDRVCERATATLFDPASGEPADLPALLDGAGPPASGGLIDSPCFELRAVTPVAAFVRAMTATRTLALHPELAHTTAAPVDPLGLSLWSAADSPVLDLAGTCRQFAPPGLPELRWLQDWQASSAGQEPMAEHWYLDLFCENTPQRRCYGFVPQSADTHGGLLPDVAVLEDACVQGLYERLEHFDSQVGYPMAWYFYGLCGAHVQPDVVRAVAEAVRAGRLSLPDCDAAVLLRWLNRPYRFVA